MRTLQTALVGVVAALFIASAAYADRIFDLEGIVTIKGFGQSFKENVSRTLTLFDDGTYTLDEGGDVSSGIWLEEGPKIQLFQEEPSISELIEELEEELSDAVGMAISVTSLVEKAAIKRTASGDITVKAKFAITLRPGPMAGKALKLKGSEKLVGLLR